MRKSLYVSEIGGDIKRALSGDLSACTGNHCCSLLLKFQSLISLFCDKFKFVTTGLPVWMLNFAMDVIRLQQQHSQLIYSLFHEGILDEQFTQLQQLQDESNPDFVSEVVALFFDDSDKLLENLGKAFEKEPIDYKKLDAHVHQFKGSSSSVGAHRVRNACIAFRAYCDENDRAGCLQCLQHMKHEYYLVKSKLQELFHLEEEILSAGGTLPLIE